MTSRCSMVAKCIASACRRARAAAFLSLADASSSRATSMWNVPARASQRRASLLRTIFSLSSTSLLDGGGAHCGTTSVGAARGPRADALVRVFVSCRALAGDSRGGRAESAVEVSVEDGRATCRSYGCIFKECCGFGLSLNRNCKPCNMQNACSQIARSLTACEASKQAFDSLAC
jgi:hypothetical protein